MSDAPGTAAIAAAAAAAATGALMSKNDKAKNLAEDGTPLPEGVSCTLLELLLFYVFSLLSIGMVVHGGRGKGVGVCAGSVDWGTC